MLNPNDIAFFNTHGYLILRNQADQQFVSIMREQVQHDLDEMIEPIEFEADVRYPGSPISKDEPGGKTVRRLKNALVRHPIFLEWLATSRMFSTLSCLLQAPIFCPMAHHNCVMTKQPSFSSETGWHQDIRYWSFNNSELISIWLALGAERKENGCLKLIPGSHQMKFTPDQFDDQKFFRHDYAPNQELISQTILAELDAGDVLLFHARTLHAATRNYSETPKWAFVATFHGENTTPNPGTRSSQMPEIVFRE
jgi:phytanoyl-CoA hydroxylase